jgi:hypothetical protein
MDPISGGGWQGRDWLIQNSAPIAGGWLVQWTDPDPTNDISDTVDVWAICAPDGAFSPDAE